MCVSPEPEPLRPEAPESTEELGLSGVYDAAISTLRLGFITAAVLFVAGIAWSAIAKEELSDQVTPIENIPRQLADGTPMAAIVLAFMVLMFTPVATVLRVGVAFLRLGDSRFGLLSFVVLAILGASMALALIR